MEMFNVFQTPIKDFNNMIAINGSEIFVNGNREYALISNDSQVKDFNDKYISTDFNMQRGDIVFYDKKYWMLTTQVGTPRFESYKSKMRQIEHGIHFNLSSMTMPQDDYILKTPALVSQTADYGLDYATQVQMLTVVSEIHVFVQDNAKTRNLLQITNSSSGSIVFGDRVYKMIGISTTNKGVLDITLNLDGSANGADVASGIFQTPANHLEVTDITMYGLESNYAPKGYQSQVMLTHTLTNASEGVNGTINLSWTQEAKRNDYVGFTGYKVRLLKDGIEHSLETVGENVLTHTFNVPEGNYVAEVCSRFSTYKGNESSNPVKTPTLTIELSEGQQSPPSNLVTNVGTIGIQNIISGYEKNNGQLIYTWFKDSSADLYSGFVGYEIQLGWYLMFGGESIRQTIEVGDITQYTFNPVQTNQYYFIRIKAKYVNDGNVFYAVMQESATYPTEQRGL